MTIKLDVINLWDVQNRLEKGKKEINLKGYKILSSGELEVAIKITASAASKAAIDKVKKAGGEIILE